MANDNTIRSSYPDVLYSMDTPPLDSIADRLEKRVEKERQERHMVLKAKELAGVIGCSEASARYRLARYGKRIRWGQYDFPDDMLNKVPRGKGIRVTEAEIERIRELEAEGMKQWQIAMVIGRSVNTVSRYAVGATKKPRVSEERIQKVREMKASECSLRKIARETGMSLETVWRYAREVKQ